MSRRNYGPKESDIGTGAWHYKECEASPVSTLGCMPVWRDPNATLDQLIAELAPGDGPHPSGFFYWREYQKRGRRIALVETGKRLYVTSPVLVQAVPPEEEIEIVVEKKDGTVASTGRMDPNNSAEVAKGIASIVEKMKTE